MIPEAELQPYISTVFAALVETKTKNLVKGNFEAYFVVFIFSD